MDEKSQENRTELAKGYEHQEVEARWYPSWKASGAFHGDEHDRTRPAFSIVLPPPNVTGSLHLGHALTATLQDVLIRWKKMSGFNTLWLPGTDHAGIATQMVVEKELKRTEKKSRHDLGRAEFLKRVWAWKEQYGSRIGRQHEALGASLDWERERFTMDEGLSRAVREVFVRLHEEGLVYREKKLINWCPDCHTALSDLEVEHEEAHQGELWSFAYPLADGGGEIVVATTRPETMLGDTAVAVHPDDPRYQRLVGQLVRHPLTGRELPIVADAELVDPEFGTGAVKVTPAHDFNDFEVGKRHGLEFLTVIGLDGKMNAAAGPVAGLDRFEARKEVKRLLAEKGLDRGTRPHVLPLGRCQRSQTILEPLLSDQWYVRIAPLAKPAIEAVEQGKTRFIPEQWTNTYMAWMRDIHDWCISRQLWWGHQIPAWYCPDGHVTVARETPSACATCGATALRQDEDVLDTWFSSGLWPFSTMGWPEQTETLKTFYPTSVMETGHDIIFFWVARMMMMGLHFMGEVPFKTVYLHPMVRDGKGQKMSKTKGNVIDPLEITEKYGADALRFTLAALTAQGRDIKLANERIEGYRAFANKLWNASRFTLMNLGGHVEQGGDPAAAARTPADRWILARLQRAVNDTVAALEAYRFNEAANGVYQFVWHELCDWYIELSKEALYGDDAAKKAGAQAVLVHCLRTSYLLLHPFMPFITEELWHVLRAQVKADAWPESILAASYPKPGPVDEAAERAFGPVLGIIDALRNVRGEMNIPFKVALGQGEPVHVAVADADTHALLAGGEERRVARLAGVERLALHLGTATPRTPQSAVAVGPGFEVRVPLAGVIDVAAETARIDKELAKVAGDLALLEKKLSNPNFVERAPAEVVAKDRARVEELREAQLKLQNHRALLLGAADTREETTMETTPPSTPTPTPETAPAAPAPAAPAPAPVVEAAPAAPAPAPAAKPVKAKKPAKKAAPKKAAKKPAKAAQKVAKKAKPAKKAAKKAKPAKKTATKKAAKKAKKK
ncbi:MAG TPA: valine--tRNA ligase [Anaeromyxobacteraceae bacterium]|nr:valine--tRNA ligase [Anaeromyxobacteraceae bacterium]